MESIDVLEYQLIVLRSFVGLGGTENAAFASYWFTILAYRVWGVRYRVNDMRYGVSGIGFKVHA